MEYLFGIILGIILCIIFSVIFTFIIASVYFKYIKIRKLNGICINNYRCSYLIKINSEYKCKLFDTHVNNNKSSKTCDTKYGKTYIGEQ